MSVGHRYRWLDYVISTATNKTRGCRVHGEYPVLLGTTELIRRVALPKCVFLASVDTIDTLDQSSEAIMDAEIREEPREFAVRHKGDGNGECQEKEDGEHPSSMDR
jgi:hypothetical protein